MNSMKKNVVLHGVFGILLLVLGVLAILMPDKALGSFVAIYAIIAILSGIDNIVFYISLRRDTGLGASFALITGILAVLLGLLMLLNLKTASLVVALLFPLWFLCISIARLANLDMICHCGGGSFWLSLITGVLGIIISLVLLFHANLSGFVFSWLIGLNLLLYGVENILIAHKLHKYC